MRSFMSPLDPIFWLHHANVDRLWAQWNASGFLNTTDPDWLNFKFPANFFTPDRKPVDVLVSQVTTTQALGYRYDTLPVALPSTLAQKSTRFFESTSSVAVATNAAPAQARR